MALLVGVWLLLSPIWFHAAVVAYVLHLVIHCLQMLVTWRKGFFLPLWSAPLQLAVVAALLVLYPDQWAIESVFPIVVMVGVAVTNLFVMHKLAAVFVRAG